MIQIVEIYNNDNMIDELKDLRSLNKNSLAIHGNKLVFKENVNNSILEILKKYPENHDSVNKLVNYIDWFDGGDFINIGHIRELRMSTCIDKLTDKIIDDESFVDKIFEDNLVDFDLNNYISNLIDIQLSNVIQDEIDNLKQMQEGIKNQKKIDWK